MIINMKKKKIKIPFKLALVGLLFSKVESIWPWLAHRWFVKIFFSTARFELPFAEQKALDSATRSSVTFENMNIQMYEWGEGVPVLFVHGWMGRATLFHEFIPVFNHAGFKVISFDSTGHGLSDGSRSHLMEFTGIINILTARYGKFKMIVGHSLGGVASLHAVRQFQATDQLVMLASPTIAQEIVEEFRKKIGASKKCEVYFERYIQATYGQRFEEYSASHIISEIKGLDLFLVYDQNDREVSMKNSEIMLHRYPEAKMMITEGLGHNRILKDKEVIESTLTFLKNSEVVMA